MKKLIFLSAYSDQHHVEFDASVINLYKEIHKECSFYLVGNKTHLIRVSKKLNDPNIFLISCSLKRKSWIYLFYFCRTFYIKSYLRVDLSGIFFSPFFFLSAVLQNQIFLHVPWWHYPDLKRKILSFINICISWTMPSMKFLVLGSWIKSEYSNTFISAKVRYLPHPYLLKGFSPNYLIQDSVFGFLGSQKSFHKGQDNLHLSSHIQSYIQKNKGILIKDDNFSLKSDFFYSSVRYSVISYLQYYDYVCSGVFIESIAYRVPIVCFKSKMSDYFFSKYGDLGFACESVSQMEQVIDKIILGQDTNQYLMFLDNIDLARTEMQNIQYIKNVYKSELLG